MNFDIHDQDSAPRDAEPLLEQSRKAYGSIPNLHGAMAEAPTMLEAYQSLSEIFARTSLSATEQQVVILAVSFENECDYCMAAHTVIAGMQDVPEPVIEALRQGQDIEDTRLEALRRFTIEVVRTRGRPGESALQAFAEAGFEAAKVFEVVLGVGLKTLSNYVNHIVETPLDAAFSNAAWSPPE